MEAKHNVFNLIILDESGSMQTIKETIISGFNEVVQTVKAVALEYPDQQHFISLLSFNSMHIKTLLENEAVEKLHEIDGSKYHPNSGTPLYDAIGKGVLDLKRVTDTHSHYNVLVTILTDGEENASKEFNGASIKKLIDELKEKNWTFTYIGANHDVEKFALSISINNVMRFETNEADMKEMFTKERAARASYSKKIRNNEDTKSDFYSDKLD